MLNHWEYKQEIDRIYHSRRYRALKYSAFLACGIMLAAEFGTMFWMDEISPLALQIIQGGVVVCGIAFSVLVVVWTYKVLSEFYSKSATHPRNCNSRNTDSLSDLQQ